MIYVKCMEGSPIWGIKKNKVYKVLYQDALEYKITLRAKDGVVGMWFPKEYFQELTNVEKLVGGYIKRREK